MAGCKPSTVSCLSWSRIIGPRNTLWWLLGSWSTVSGLLRATAYGTPFSPSEGKLSLFTWLIKLLTLRFLVLEWQIFWAYRFEGSWPRLTTGTFTAWNVQKSNNRTKELSRCPHEWIPSCGYTILQLPSVSLRRHSLSASTSCRTISGNILRSYDLLYLPCTRKFPYSYVTGEAYHIRLLPLIIQAHWQYRVTDEQCEYW